MLKTSKTKKNYEGAESYSTTGFPKMFPTVASSFG
jgi:hypothetical protein